MGFCRSTNLAIGCNFSLWMGFAAQQFMQFSAILFCEWGFAAQQFVQFSAICSANLILHQIALIVERVWVDSVSMMLPDCADVVSFGASPVGLFAPEGSRHQANAFFFVTR